MMRVLNVISCLNHAGTEAVVMNYYRNIDRSKVQFDFLVLDERENQYYEEEIESLGGRIYKLPPLGKKPLKNILKRRKFFKEHVYDVVEVHAPSATRYAFCKSAKKHGAKKVIYHIHNTCDKKGIIISHARKQIEKYCDETVTCSQKAAISVLGHKADKVVYNAIDCSKYSYNSDLRKKIRDFYKISDDTKVIGHVGRFSKQKNHSFLLDVFGELLKRDKNYVLLLKGFGELEQELKDRVAHEGLSGNIIFTGNDFEADELYNSFDLFLLPSLWEGLAVVLIEAQVNGLKPIVSDAIPEEADLCDGLTILKLNLKEWVDFIEKNGRNRRFAGSEIINNNYDIKVAAKQREEDYLKTV